jgi:hypothetical protein
MTLLREHRFACDRCGLAGIAGVADFTWRRYPLGNTSYFGMIFMTCVKCGLIHCHGQNPPYTERSDLFAQPEVLRLSKTTCVVIDSKGEHEEEVDCVKLAPWQPCGQRRVPHTLPKHEADAVVEINQFFCCRDCRRPGTLGHYFLLSGGKQVRCPVCGQESLRESFATVLHPGNDSYYRSV